MQSDEMQKGMGGIAIFVIIVLVAVLGGALVYLAGKNKSTVTQESAVVSPTTIVQGTPTGVVSGDTSDEGLAKDSADVDTKLKAAAEDSANVDAGLNDVQGNLSEQ